MEWTKMLIILGVLGIYLAFFFINFNKKNKQSDNAKQVGSATKVEKADTTTSYPIERKVDNKPKLEQPIPFGFKSTWLAIKTKDRYKVSKALSLKQTRDANWSQGLESAYDNKGWVFVTPALGEWTLVAGRSLPNPDESDFKTKLTSLLIKISKDFDEAQYYSTYRANDSQAWIRAVNGQIIRAYAVIGEKNETVWDKGDITRIEKDLGLSGKKSPTEEDVHQISTKWSVDTFFEAEKYKPANGLIGKL